ncbi:MAG TPA: cupin domain-containing protein [Flavisolibacter sp.]|jgi:mannose-6-phosphate isomerase-like protein (cupin superfamily)|nr:cupin domain-containing protein [Flavisolibacter sp.]
MPRQLKDISDQIVEHYKNFILETVNDHSLRMSVMNGEYRWHYHPQTDELFIIVEGALTIEIKDGPTHYLQPGEFLKIPAGVIHKTSTTTRTVNLCFEKTESDTVFVE